MNEVVMCRVNVKTCTRATDLRMPSCDHGYMLETQGTTSTCSLNYSKEETRRLPL